MRIKINAITFNLMKDIDENINTLNMEDMSKHSYTMLTCVTTVLICTSVSFF